MTDIGYKVWRDSCGKDSNLEVIGRAWKLPEAKKIMSSALAQEMKELEDAGRDVVAIVDDKRDIAEIREGRTKTLVSYYTVEEFTQ